MKNNKPLVLMTHDLPEDWVGELLEDYQVITGFNEERGLDSKLIKHLDKAEGILCLLDDPIPAELLERAPNLKVVSSMAVGVDNIDVAVCTRLGIPVGHTPGVLTEGTADLTVALLLAVCRQLPTASEDARQGRWTNWDPTGWLGMDLKNSIVGIIGLGKIGTAVGERLAAFGAQIIFTNRSPQPEKEKKLNATQVNLDELLRTGDFICLHAPLTKETANLINEQAFQKMKSSAILINAARGAIVDTAALTRALKEGQIRAAGLDVTYPEPLPPSHPLYKMDNCLITPHIGSATFQIRQTMAKIALENLSAGIKGIHLPYCANPEVYT
ncbi:MAG: D-glycerate dehydrogenase [Anaerolineales bacterium]|nr:D-glycerate dehydrogenase [Anaerolineales bacterium]